LDVDQWDPHVATIVIVHDVAFGLTLYEPSELVPAEYDDDFNYVRAEPGSKPRWPGRSDWVNKEEMPSGRLALRAYSAHR